MKAKFSSFVSRCSHVWCRSQRFDCILLVLFRRWGRLVMRDLIKHDARCGWLVFNSSDWCISILAVSLSDLLPRRSAVARLSCCFVFYRGHPRFWNFYSIIPVDVVRVKSYMNCLFDPTCVLMRVTINKLYFVPEWLVSGVVGVL